jgi:Fusaric acid resistance protein-like
VSGHTESVEAASPPLWRVLARRTGFGVLLLAIVFVPFVVFYVISGGEIAASMAIASGLATLTVLMYAGRPFAFLAAGLFTALTPIAIVSGAVPVAGAALMGLMCFGVGVSASGGLNRAMQNIPMYLGFMIVAPPPWTGLTGDDRTTTSYVLWNMLFMGGGALWAALVFPPILRKQKMPVPLRPLQPWVRVDVVVYTITITVLCAASMLAILMWWPGSDLAWLPTTVLAVSGLGVGGVSVKRTLARIGGTVIGFAIAVIVASVVGSEAVLIGIALVLAVIAIVVMFSSPSYLFFEAFVVPVVVLLTATSIADVAKTDAERLAAVVIGGALVLIASGIALWWTHYQQASSPSG